MSTLKENIDAYNAAKQERLPAEILDTMARCTEDLKLEGIEKRALRAGDRMLWCGRESVRSTMLRTLWDDQLLQYAVNGKNQLQSTVLRWLFHDVSKRKVTEKAENDAKIS